MERGHLHIGAKCLFTLAFFFVALMRSDAGERLGNIFGFDVFFSHVHFKYIQNHS